MQLLPFSCERISFLLIYEHIRGDLNFLFKKKEENVGGNLDVLI